MRALRGQALTAFPLEAAGEASAPRTNRRGAARPQGAPPPGGSPSRGSIGRLGAAGAWRALGAALWGRLRSSGRCRPAPGRPGAAAELPGGERRRVRS